MKCMKKKVLKPKEMSIDDLARMVAKGFSSVGEKFETIEEKIDTLDKKFQILDQKVETIDQNVKATRRDMLNIGDTFVSYRKFDELASRVTKLEKSKK